jgi:hypothetical protein
MAVVQAEKPPTKVSSRAMPGTDTSVADTSWILLEQGQNVVLEKGNQRFAGTVDALTDDRDIVWLRSSVGERRLFHVGDGYALLHEPPIPAAEGLKGCD